MLGGWEAVAMRVPGDVPWWLEKKDHLSDTGLECRLMRVLVFSDAFVGDGRAGWAFVADGLDGIPTRMSGPLPGSISSHEAEWVAVSRALAWAEGALAPGDELELRVDSALVAKGLASRRPEMSGAAAQLRAACRQALARMGQAGIRARVVRVRREENAEADAAARAAAFTDSS